MQNLLARAALWRWRRNIMAAAFSYGPRRQQLALRAAKWRRIELWLSGLPSDDMEVAG